MQSTIDLIPLRNSLSRDSKYNKIKTAVLTQLEEFADEKYKSNPEVILHLITILENLIDKKDKIDKLELAVNIFSELFKTTDGADIRAFSGIVEFLLDNKQVKKIGSIKYVSKYARSFFCG